MEKSAESIESVGKSVEKPVESAEKSVESVESTEKSAEKSTESVKSKISGEKLSKRQKQILACMQQGKSYSTEEVAHLVGLKGSRTRQLLNELVALELVSCTATTKNRRYVKE